MFRKRTKKPGKNLRRKRTEESETNEADEDDEAIGIAIRKTMKKQKILASLPLTSSIPKGKSESGLLSDAKKSEASSSAAPAELSVLAKKHVRNMEAYIEEKIAATQQQQQQQTNGSSANHPDSVLNATDATNSEAMSEEDLYRQLAQEVTDAAGGGQASADNPHQQQQQGEADGESGAALLVGTGIAEVILPATQHKPMPVSTNHRVYNKNNSMLSSAVPEGERHKHVLSKTTPKPFVKFRNSNTNALSSSSSQSNNEGNNHENNQEETQQTATSSATRQGFDAFRGKAPAPDASASDGDNKDNNNKQRWKTGKDRDDQVYSHFLKNALNGKRR